VSHIYTFFKGRVALYAILKAMGISSNDEVIVPGFTCVVVPNAIMYALAKPVYVDIDKKDYNIDVDKIEEKITKNTKVIIAQHTFGIPANMDRIVEICKRYKLYLIEDACHALGSTYKGKGAWHNWRCGIFFVPVVKASNYRFRRLGCGK